MMHLSTYKHKACTSFTHLASASADRNLNTVSIDILIAGVFPSTLSYHCFCVPNWVCRRPKAFSHAKDMKKSSGVLQNAVGPPVGPGQSLGGGPRGEVPGSSAYLAFENLLF